MIYHFVYALIKTMAYKVNTKVSPFLGVNICTTIYFTIDVFKFQIGILEEDAEQQKLAENNLKSQVQSLEKLMESNKTMNETLSHSIMTEDNTHLMNEMCSLQNENVRSPGFCKSKFLFYYSFGILFPNS